MPGIIDTTPRRARAGVMLMRGGSAQHHCDTGRPRPVVAARVREASGGNGDGAGCGEPGNREAKGEKGSPD